MTEPVTSTPFGGTGGFARSGAFAGSALPVLTTSVFVDGTSLPAAATSVPLTGHVGRCMINMLAVASAAPSRHNDGNTPFIGELPQQPRRTDKGNTQRCRIRRRMRYSDVRAAGLTEAKRGVREEDGGTRLTFAPARSCSVRRPAWAWSRASGRRFGGEGFLWFPGPA